MYHAEEVADRLGISVEDLWARIEQHHFPAPDHLCGEGLVPLWAAETIANPKARLPQWHPTNRQAALEHLRDEVVLWAARPENRSRGGLVPQHAMGRRNLVGPTRFPLGSRVAGLRHAYLAGRVPPEDVAKFEAIPGWSWDFFADQWLARFESVASRWPDKTTDRDRLWLASQRQRWDVLRPEWQARLGRIPGLLDKLSNSRALDFVEAAKRWMAAENTTMADVRWETSWDDPALGVVPLGKRVTYYRRRYRGLEGASHKPLPPEEVAALEALPGWSWTGKRGPAGAR